MGNRFSLSNNSTNILKYMTNITKVNNTDKEVIDFEAVGIKKYLCSQICLQTNDYFLNIDEINTKQPNVKKFIESICLV